MKTLYSVKTTNEIITNPENGSTHLGVTINWFCESRMQPIVHYDQAIPEWKTMLENDCIDDYQLSYYNTAATYVDQFFTFEEALELKDCLIGNQASNVIIEPVAVPLENADVPYVSIMEQCGSSKDFGFIDLPKSTLNSFALPVRGYFDVKYNTTLERYQESIVASLINFKVPVSNNEYSHYREMVKGFKEQISSLCDSLANLRNVLEIMSHGASCRLKNCQNDDNAADSEN